MVGRGKSTTTTITEGKHLSEGVLFSVLTKLNIVWKDHLQQLSLVLLKNQASYPALTSYSLPKIC